MTERPILFSGPMVRAILEGRKTQTRRLVKPQPPDHEKATRHHQRILVPRCPYGGAGDRLWVRETFKFCGETIEGRDRYRYRADENPATDGFVWKPAIHMPRRACRLVLEVTAVRVERLQDISEADAKAEGLIQHKGDLYTWWASGHERLDQYLRNAHLLAVDAYRHLWDYINAKRAPWASNPWVWVVEFKRA